MKPEELRFVTFWSYDDKEWVCTCDTFPSLSWMDSTPAGALNGYITVLRSEYPNLWRDAKSF